MNGLESLNRLHSKTGGNASLYKIKCYSGAVDIALKLKLS